jgi:cyclic beta-1,2-glucan synthetase
VNFAVELEGIAASLIAKVDELCWDGEHYLRAFYDDGTPMGSYSSDKAASSGQSQPSPACKIDLLPQAFAVLAEMPDSARVNEAMNSALRELYDADNRIIKLFTPPFNRNESDNVPRDGVSPSRGGDAQKAKVSPELKDPGYVQSYPPGVRENGGQYSHAAVWLALACHRLGMKDKARELVMAMSPANRPESYKTEPYYLAADIYTNPKAYGRGGWSIYTGSAGWYYRVLNEIYGEVNKS